MEETDEQVTLQSQEGEDFVVSLPVAKMSGTIKNLIEDAGTASAIPLPNVTAATLALVHVYCKQHVADPALTADEAEKEKTSNEVGPWDTEFFKPMITPQPSETLFSLILAANYLDIAPLLNVTCKVVANCIKGKTPEEIRKTFNIKNDFTPEEEEQIRKENEWCEEK